MDGRRRLLVAIAASFAVYAVPIVTVHFGDLFGLSLIRELSSDRAAGWIATDMALALAVQAAWGLLVWLGLRFGIGGGILTFVLAALPAMYAVNAAYLVKIPELFLIEEDGTPDSGTLAEECSAPVELIAAPAGVTRGFDQRGGAIVALAGGTTYGVMQLPDCKVEPLAIPQLRMAPGINQVLPDGSVVYSAYKRTVSGQDYWLLGRGTTEGVLLAPPPEVTESYAIPLVSEDGGWVAWSRRSPDRVMSVLVQPVQGGDPIEFTHPLLQNATITLVELDMTRRTITVNRDLSTFVAIGLDGTLAWGPVTPPGIAAQYSTFRYAGGQWLAWDAYVENRGYRVSWSTKHGSDTYDVPRGRSVTAAALSPLGRYVAVSTTTDLNIGSVRDTVLVRRTDTGADVFRKTLPRYSRSHVAFLGDRHVAYTDVNGGKATVHVLQLPE
jgi:hypothetical protein